MSSNNVYFAKKEAKDTASILLNRAEMWFQNFDTSGYKDKLRDMYTAYHGMYYDDGHKISFGGEQGELAQLPVNEIRNLATHMLIMTTSNRPTMEARAVNTDYKSKVQTQLANGILDYYMREKRLEKYLKTAVEYAIVLGSGYIKVEWDALEGEIHDYILDEETGEPDPNQPIYDGDIKFSNLSPLDVVFDNTKESDDHDWVMVRSFKNKYDLAAKFPELEDKIVELATKSDVESFHLGINSDVHSETDDIYVYEFYHKKTAAMPNGRYILFLNEDIILHDVPMPYRMLPVFRIAPANILGTPFGYTPLFDVLPIQQGQNALYSTILTNQNAFGVQNLFVEEGSNLNTTRLEGGLNIITGMKEPKSLNLTNTPTEIFKFLELLKAAGETLSGVNSVARGNTEGLGSNPSGTAMALIQSMALQFMSGLQQSYVQLVEDVGNSLIKILQDYANTPRLIAIAGKNNKTEMKMFSSEKIGNITRVIVDVGNPLSRTTAGRVQMASELMQYAADKITPQQYITLINTGKLEAITEPLQDEDNLLSAENEALMDGEIPPVMITDQHSLHIKHHRSVLHDPQLRKDPELVARVTQHIQMHINELKQADPMLLQLIGEQSLAPPPAPPGPDGAPAPMEAPMEGQMGVGPNPENPEQIMGPGIEGGASMPNLPKVDPNLLPAPEMVPNVAQG